MDWSKYNFARPELAAKLMGFGITDLKNLHSRSANQRSQLDRKFAADCLSLNWNSVDSTHASLNSALKAEVDWDRMDDGVDPQAAAELKRMGITNIDELEQMSPTERTKFKAALKSKNANLDWGRLGGWFAGPRFGFDLTKAFGWMSTLKPAPSHLNFGRLCDSEPNQIDNLSRIDGIGNATESDLNRIGIYHFSQIAYWTDKNSPAVAEALGLENRIQQDSWIELGKMFLPREPQ